MNMREIQSERRLCSCCMEEHEVKTVRMMEHTNFKNERIDYEATYFYCDNADELYMDEQQIQNNDVVMKDAYRKKQGLLTSREIIAIRGKYCISQSDLCTLLGWGGKTITRYESHQVQDKAHDTILKKLNQDPEWFLDLLTQAKSTLASEAYRKCHDAATALYEKNQDAYLRRAIEARYARFQNNRALQGNAELSLDKVVDVIRYFASSGEISNLYKVKLMKLMWYADILSYKLHGRAITGLVYQALPMGAVPIGHESIISLRGVPCEEVDMGETNAYHFSLPDGVEYPSLDIEDKKVLDDVIQLLGHMTKDEIVTFMHNEDAYKKTQPRDYIPYDYAKTLQI